jgi:hypothetical protein
MGKISEYAAKSTFLSTLPTNTCLTVLILTDRRGSWKGGERDLTADTEI